jgi:HopA1 effector protein family
VSPVIRYRDQVAAALAAVTILSPTRYAWLGRKSRPLPVSLDPELDEPERRRYLVSCLRQELYRSFYRHGSPVVARWGEPEPAAADPWLVEALSRANTGRGSWESGWRVERLAGEEAVAKTAGLRARVPIGDCRASGGTVRRGAAVSVRLPKELRELSPGFYTVVSDAPVDPASSASVVRVYWNVARAGAPALVRTLTSRLNSAGVPFGLKVADHPVRLDRCDAAVLYLEGEIFRELRDELRDVAAALTAHLRPQIPAFTLQHAPGVGLAEDDGGGESFGERRCALLADGVVRAHERRIAPGSARVDAVAARFAEDEVSIDAPYLEPSFAGRHVL